MLSSEQFKSLLAQSLDAEIHSVEFDLMTYPKKPDTRPDASWRDHLLRTFSVRLKGAIEHKADSGLVAELTRFVENLERLDRTVSLYCWQAKTSRGSFSGWATDGEIISKNKFPAD